jgi:hypothetical protein
MWIFCWRIDHWLCGHSLRFAFKAGWTREPCLRTQRMQPCTSGRDLGGVTERPSNYQDMAMYVCESTDRRRRVGGCWNESVLLNIFYSHFWLAFLTYIIQHCFICCPSESNVSEDGGIEYMILRHWHWQCDALTTWLNLILNSAIDLIHTRLDLIHYSARSPPQLG